MNYPLTARQQRLIDSHATARYQDRPAVSRALERMAVLAYWTLEDDSASDHVLWLIGLERSTLLR